MLGEVIILSVDKFDSIKCQRCWNHFEASEIKGDLCHHCFDVISKMV